MNNSNETKERKKLDLKRITESRVFWMILSLLAASLLWMYVTTTEGVEVEKTLTGVKIEFLGADAMRASSDLIVTEQDRTTVNLTLSGHAPRALQAHKLQRDGNGESQQRCGGRTVFGFLRYLLSRRRERERNNARPHVIGRREFLCGQASPQDH